MLEIESINETVDAHKLFKAHIGLAMSIIVLATLFMLQVTMSFLGVLVCGACCSGERMLGVCAFIFAMIGLVIIAIVPVASVAIGWTYAFGDCSGPVRWNELMATWDACSEFS